MRPLHKVPGHFDVAGLVGVHYINFSLYLLFDIVPVVLCMSLQLIDPKELLGPSSGCSGQLRALAFSVYSRCRPHAEISIEGARSLTTFGPIADRLEHNQVCLCVLCLHMQRESCDHV